MRLVVGELRRSPGLTVHRLAELTRLSPARVERALVELRDAGLIASPPGIALPPGRVLH